MTNILILGGNSFIARSIKPLLEQDYNVNSLTREELNVCDINQLKDYLQNNSFDFVINCALSGKGRLLTPDSSQNFYENLLIQENLLHLQDLYKKLIIFSSGAQENRNNDIVELKEGQFFDPPIDYYSLAKYINAKRVIGNNKIINIRIFNVFGPLEAENRFIKSNILKYINKHDIEIWGDAYFDFFYYKDLVALIKYLINNSKEEYQEYNAVYSEFYKLSEIAGIINGFDDYKVNINILEGINKHYTGCCYNISKLQLPYVGLRIGIWETYKEILDGQPKTRN